MVDAMALRKHEPLVLKLVKYSTDRMGQSISNGTSMHFYRCVCVCETEYRGSIVLNKDAHLRCSLPPVLVSVPALTLYLYLPHLADAFIQSDIIETGYW